MADKKLAKKLAKMTEEERASFLENQRLQEAEERKKREEMLYRYLKNKLIKEEEVSKVNMLKVQKQWRNIMRKSKITILYSYVCMYVYITCHLPGLYVLCWCS